MKITKNERQLLLDAMNSEKLNLESMFTIYTLKDSPITYKHYKKEIGSIKRLIKKIMDEVT
jgi:hypothetical protein